MERIRLFVAVCWEVVILMGGVACLPTQTVYAATAPQEAPAPLHVYFPHPLPHSDDRSGSETLPSLEEFTAHMVAPDAQGLQGVYAAALFAYRVVPQPAGNYNYVSTAPQTVTQFSLVGKNVIGLLAHNNLAGQKFAGLSLGQEIDLITAQGEVSRYVVSARHAYQALTPNSPTSNFIDLDSGETLSAAQLFAKYYQGDKHLTLQTCIQKGASLSWGRLFIVATPLQ